MNSKEGTEFHTEITENTEKKRRTRVGGCPSDRFADTKRSTYESATRSLNAKLIPLILSNVLTPAPM